METFILKIKTYAFNDMLPNPILAFVILGLGVSIFIFIMLLPALFELKKPKDAGPRMIRDYTFPAHLAIKEILIANLEEKQGFDQTLAKKIADAINVLPNLEV
jgi:hypothetical protein